MRNKTRKRLETLGYTAIPVTILVLFAYIASNPQAVGVTTGDGGILVDLFPGLFLILVSLYLLAKSRGTGQLGGMMGVVLGLGFFLNTADTEGLIPAELLAGLTVNELQIWTMALSVIFGGILYSYNK